MWKFIQYEIKNWLKTPMLWIFLLINTLLVFFAIASDKVNIGGSVGNIHKNAPYIIEQYYAIFSIICLLMTTAFMNATANRDFQSGMYQFIFTSPITKREYFFGKYIGASIAAVIPLLGITIGSLLAPPLAKLFHMTDAERFGDVVWQAHIQGFFGFGVANVIITGVLLYGLAVIFRSNIVSFIGAMFILIVYVVSQGFAEDIKKEWLTNLLDPLGGQPLDNMTKYATVAEKNTLATYITGDLLINRIVWVGLALILLFMLYRRFSFELKNEKVKKVKTKEATAQIPVLTHKNYLSQNAGTFSFVTLWKLIKFETLSIIKNPTFIIIIAIGLMNLTASLAFVTELYGLKQYPITYHIIETIDGSFNFFLMAFITFYAGVLIWKERDAKINEIQDATPISNELSVFSKIIALLLAVVLVELLCMFMGITVQVLNSYTHLEIGLYLKNIFLIQLPKMFFGVSLAVLIHTLVNNRYIGYFVFIAFIIVNSFIWRIVELDSNMLRFGALPDYTYSDMNGYGPFVKSRFWFAVYWFLFCLWLTYITIAYFVKGKETALKQRTKNALSYLSSKKWVLTVLFVLFGLTAGYVYYNTQVLNTYHSSKEYEVARVNYEKKYKKYQKIPQPRYIAIDYQIHIFPEKRNLDVVATAWLKNKTNEPISEIHFTMPTLSDSLKIEIPNAKLKVNDKDLGYRIYTLGKPLPPKDSLSVRFVNVHRTKGFENEVSFTELTQNGTFFNNLDILPSIGYSSDAELSDKNDRVKYQLPARERMPKLNPADTLARMNNYIISDADWVNIHTTISTSIPQTAVAPGSLIKKWQQDGRNYFEYQLDKASINFYSFISADYQVVKRKWKDKNLEVYYSDKHPYNIENMLNGMQKSLAYYTANFGPYYHNQCRILEFPQYELFAQSFPGTMPYSEGMGFISDLRKVKTDDIDMVFYVVAHEMAHQYWAHQVMGANMQGSELLSEGLAQYSALMVMEKEYGHDKMKKFLEYEMDKYLSGRSTELEGEQPLIKTESQQYIHYNKASVVLYYLKEMIGEQNVNKALQALVQKYAYQQPPYATSMDLIDELRKVTPETYQYLIVDMFENITLFSNRVLDAQYTITKDGKYQVTLKTRSEKFRSDAKGNETPIPVSDYIDIAVFAQPQNDAQLGKILYYQRVKITRTEQIFNITVNEKPYTAGIDPYNYLIDRVPEDNLKKF